MSKFILYFLLIISSFILTTYLLAENRIVSEVNLLKEVNGSSGIEFGVRGSKQIGLTTFKFGVSEGFTAPRDNVLGFNHAGVRVDIGAYWTLPYEFELGYIHSERSWFDGASPKDIFNYNSIDCLSLRKEYVW